MSTTPVNNLNAVGSKALGVFSFLEHHLVVAVMALGIAAVLVYGSVSTVDKMITAHDEKKDALIEKVLASKDAIQQQLLDKMSSDKAANDAKDAAKDAEIANLAAQLQADHIALQNQLKKDSTLDAQGAAARLIEQEHAQAGQAVPSGSGVLVDLPLTRQIVADLDKGAQAQKDVTNVQAQYEAQKILTDDARQNFANAQKVIDADKDKLIAQINADNSACQVKVDKERNAGNKKGFWGYVAGVVSMLLLKH